MTESEEKRLESLCADISYMFVLNNQNEIVYVVNDTQLTSSITEEEYSQALDSFITLRFQFKSLYDLVNEHCIQPNLKSHHKRLCMECLANPDTLIIHDMCIHEFIAFLERNFRERNIIQLN